MSETGDGRRLAGLVLPSLPRNPPSLAAAAYTYQAWRGGAWRALANVLTCSVFVLGIAALGARDQPQTATLLLVLAGLLDALDGSCARRAGGATGYGAALDLVADFTAFALVPAAFIHFNQALFDPWLLPVLVLFLAASAGRLIRSCRNERRPHDLGFVGLPMPAAGLLVLALSFLPAPSLAASVVIVSVLAISRRPYPSLHWLWRQDRPVLVAVAVVAATASALVPASTLIVVTVVYAAYPWLRAGSVSFGWKRKELGMP